METKRDKILIFIGSFLIGAALFIACYGTGVLDVTNVDWIFGMADPDIKQHFLGWCHYRESAWDFPLGLISTLSYPYKMSVLYTDSMPLVAFICKLLSPLLPHTFQYLGWYGLISTGLTGGVGALILLRLTHSRYASIIGSAAFCIAPHMLQRMFYHTTLTAQWLILLPILLWLNDTRKKARRKKCLIWAVYSFVAVTIHPYLFAMGAFIWGFSAIEELILNKKLQDVLFQAASIILTALLGLWLMGAFYGDVEQVYLAGGYTANMNTFFNPIGKSMIFPDLPLQNGLQYEGYGYLGAGMILLILIDITCILFKNRRSLHPVKYCKKHLRFTLFLGTFVFFCAFAVFPEISLNTKLFLTISQPGIIGDFFGTFRSTGRFIWPAVWILYIGAFTLCVRNFKTTASIVIIFACVFLQVYDLSGAIAEKNEDITKEHRKAHSDLDDDAVTSKISRYKHIVMTYDDNIEMNNLAYFAYRYGLTMNSYYYARGIEELIALQLDKYNEGLRSGEDYSDCIFVLKDKNFDEWKDCGLNFYYIDNSIIGVKEPLDGLEKVE
ncbi:MAG: DUF6311 domain-containing protein [Lachnospiraceae bacterium]|nr:DUF6311 domain-containing protein [Lachnospiraceae bacterium]